MVNRETTAEYACFGGGNAKIFCADVSRLGGGPTSHAMAVIVIQGADDDRLAEYRDVPAPDAVRSRGLFVAEGRRVVERLVGTRRFRIRSLLVSEPARRALEPTLALLDPDVPIYVCGAGDFAGITGFDLHRGCLALVHRPSPVPPAALMQAARTLIVLEAVANADNIGGVFRNAAAFGAGAVLLSPSCCDPLYRKAIRTSMAATLRVPFARVEDWPDGLSEIRARGFAIVALTPRVGSQPLDVFAGGPRPDRLALLVGAEDQGLSAAAEAAADYHVRIPIAPDVDSLNLAVATGIALSWLLRGGGL